MGLHNVVSERQDTPCYLIRSLFQVAMALRVTIHHSQLCLYSPLAPLLHAALLPQSHKANVPMA